MQHKGLIEKPHNILALSSLALAAFRRGGVERFTASGFQFRVLGGGLFWCWRSRSVGYVAPSGYNETLRATHPKLWCASLKMPSTLNPKSQVLRCKGQSSPIKRKSS